MDCSHHARSLSNGALVRSERIGAFVLVESRYAPHMRVGWHAHEQSMISVVVWGGIEEGHRSAAERFGPGTASIKPGEVDHYNAVGPAGMGGLAITRCDDDSQFGADWAAAVSGYRWLAGGPAVRALFDIRSILRQPKGPDRALALEERLALLVGDLARSTPAPNVAPRWLLAVRDRLHALSEGAVPGARLADFAGVHPVYLARTFRRHFGCCMSNYVQRLRVRRAAELLQDRRRPLAQVALHAGLSDQAHLCRLFKREFGLTPGGYRRMIPA